MIALMKGKPFHAPVKHPKRVLDIGCGTGAMTVLLAKLFPDAEVIGVDISPVPDVHEKLPNLKYIQGNVLELAKSGDPIFAAASFDYIFHRLLIFGITDWPAYVSTVKGLLRPGGWTEMQDFDMIMFSHADENLSEGYWWYQWFLEDCQAIGLDLRAGSKLPGHMKDAGLSDVSERFYKSLIIPHPDSPEADLIAKNSEKNMGANNLALLKRVSGSRRSAEDVEKMHAGMEEVFAKLKPGDHVRIFVATGQRAE